MRSEDGDRYYGKKCSDIPCSQVEGQVESITFNSDHGRIEYRYEYNGCDYLAGNNLWLNGETSKLESHDRVDLIIDPENPSRAYITSLYLGSVGKDK